MVEGDLNNVDVKKEPSIIDNFINLTVPVKIVVIVCAFLGLSFIYDFIAGPKNNRHVNLVTKKPSEIVKPLSNDSKLGAVEPNNTELNKKSLSFHKTDEKPKKIAEISIFDDKKLNRIKKSASVKLNGEKKIQTSYKKFNLSRVITKGTKIKSTLNSYMSSNIGGRVEVLVAEDILSADKNNILIPRGSKIFGTFDRIISIQMKKLSILWEDVLFTNGYSLKLPLSSVSPNGQFGNSTSYKYEGFKRIGSYFASTVTDVGLSYGSASLSNYINSLSNKTSANTEVSKLISSINTVDTVKELNDLIKGSNIDDLIIKGVEAALSLDIDPDVNKKKQTAIRHLSAYINTSNDNTSSYINQSMNNLSGDLKKEFNILLGQYDDFFENNIGETLYLVLDSSFTVPDDIVSSKNNSIL